MGRVSTATDEDIRYLQGMNRIRHAYHEAVGGLEPYFISGQYDDVVGIFGVSSADVEFRVAAVDHPRLHDRRGMSG